MKDLNIEENQVKNEVFNLNKISDVVSLKLSILLRNNGFPQKNTNDLIYVTKNSEFYINGVPVRYKVGNILSSDYIREFYDNTYYSTIPSYSSVLRWLREIHGYHIAIEIFPIYKKYYARIYNISSNSNLKFFSVYEDDGFETYEECIEYSITYCINNLINTKYEDL